MRTKAFYKLIIEIPQQSNLDLVWGTEADQKVWDDLWMAVEERVYSDMARHICDHIRGLGGTDDVWGV